VKGQQQAMALQKAALEEEVQIHQIKMNSSSTSFFLYKQQLTSVQTVGITGITLVS